MTPNAQSQFRGGDLRRRFGFSSDLAGRVSAVVALPGRRPVQLAGTLAGITGSKSFVDLAWSADGTTFSAVTYGRGLVQAPAVAAGG